MTDGWDGLDWWTFWKDRAAVRAQLDAVAFACAYAGLRLTDARAVTGPADGWVRL